MSQTCSVCSSPLVREIDRRARANTPAVDIELWAQSQGSTLTRHAIGRHLRAGHAPGAVNRPRGPRVVSDDFLTAVRDAAHEDLAAGELRPTLRDGIASQVALDQRTARYQDRQLMARIALALTGSPLLDRPRDEWDDERDALEGEFRALVAGGDEAIPLAIGPGNPEKLAAWRR